MEPKPPSAIRRLVDHHGGVTKTAQLLGEDFAYQSVQQWLDRDWASPMHFLKLEALLPAGLSIGDLYADRERAKQPKESA